VAVNIYKPGQGKYTRLLTLAGGELIGLTIAREFYKNLNGADLNAYIVYGVPLAVFVGISVLMLWIVNQPRSADFMIATESEMKKVSWSSRRELIGGTKVVIVTTLLMALTLGAVDLAFNFFFVKVGVLIVTGGGAGGETPVE
jgi:preprotein translocase subunit SecE